MKKISVNASAHPQYKDITILSVTGFIDTNTAPEFEKVFQTGMRQKKFNIIVDLKETSYVSSAGWGIFVGEIKRIRSQKGNLFLVGMSQEVTNAYELLQFDSILKAFPTAEQAIQKGFKQTVVAADPIAETKPVVKSRKSKVEAIPQPVTEPAKAPLNLSFVEPEPEKIPAKTPWFKKFLALLWS